MLEQKPVRSGKKEKKSLGTCSINAVKEGILVLNLSLYKQHSNQPHQTKWHKMLEADWMIQHHINGSKPPSFYCDNRSKF